MRKPDEQPSAVPGRVLPPGRWMDILEGFLTIALILVALAGVAIVLIAVSVAWPGSSLGSFASSLGGITVPALGADVSVGDLLAPGVVAADVAVEVTVRNVEPAPLAGLVYTLGRLPELLIGGLALLWLVQVLRGGRADDRVLFSAFTASRLRRIGALLVVGSVGSALLWGIARTVLTHLALPDTPLLFAADFQWFGFLAGIAALAVSEIVRRGVVLLEEVEGTI